MGVEEGVLPPPPATPTPPLGLGDRVLPELPVAVLERDTVPLSVPVASVLLLPEALSVGEVQGVGVEVEVGVDLKEGVNPAERVKPPLLLAVKVPPAWVVGEIVLTLKVSVASRDGEGKGHRAEWVTEGEPLGVYEKEVGRGVREMEVQGEEVGESVDCLFKEAVGVRVTSPVMVGVDALESERVGVTVPHTLPPKGGVLEGRGVGVTDQVGQFVTDTPAEAEGEGVREEA